MNFGVVAGESFSRSFKEMVRMCLQKETRKRPTVQTLANCKFFKAKRSVTPLVEELLNRVDNVTVRAMLYVLVYDLCDKWRLLRSLVQVADGSSIRHYSVASLHPGISVSNASQAGDHLVEHVPSVC